MSPRETAMMNAATAIEKEAERQYRAGRDWEEAKDVIEGTDYCRLLDAAVASLLKSGFAVLPIESTDSMEVAASAAPTKHVECLAYVDAAIVWRAMVAAVQEQHG